jgi:hypothetical protein
VRDVHSVQTDPHLQRSSLSLGQQLRWTLQLRLLHQVSLLRVCCLLIPPRHGNPANERLLCERLLGKFGALLASIIQRQKAQPGNLEIVFIIMNYVACVPVIVMVGLFR